MGHPADAISGKLMSRMRIEMLALALGPLALCCQCSSERSVAPPLADYYLYVGRVSATDESIIDVIDTRADSIVSVMTEIGIARLESFTVSPDGRYLAALDSDGSVSVIDLRTEQPVGLIREKISRIIFVSSPLRLLCVTTDSILVCNLPDVHVSDIWHTAVRSLVDCCQSGELLAVRRVTSPETPNGDDRLIRINSLSGNPIDSVAPRCGSPLAGIAIYSLHYNQTANDIHMEAGDSRGMAVEAFEPGVATCRFKTALESPWSTMTITGGGEEIWVTQDYSTFDDPIPKHLGYVLILDAKSGSPIDTIRTLGVSLGSPSDPVAVFFILAHPHDEKVYVGARIGRPALLVYDRESRELIKSFYTDSPAIIHGLAIAPR